MKTITKLLFLLLALVSISNFVFSQSNSNKTFFTGYYGGADIDSVYKNYMYIERNDTGLVFRKTTFDILYDFSFSQNSTYCDDNGIPVLQWQGCFLLDSKTFNPIENGEFNYGLGTEEDGGTFCTNYKYPSDPGPGVTDLYGFSYASFFLDSGDKDNLLLVYYRMRDEQNIYLNLAGIDLDGGINGGPVVTFKDSLIAGNTKLKFGSVNAIKKGDGKGWYIVYSELLSPNWYSILIDDLGIHAPVKSVISEQDSTKYFEGTIIFSPDGKKAATIYNQEFFVLDFDRCNGKFNFFFKDTIPDDSQSAFYGFVEFSPSGRFLYLNNLLYIYQFDLLSDDISSSRTLIAKIDFSISSGIPGHEDIPGVFTTPIRGKDGKIYYWCANTVPKIHRIAYPDQKGPNVGFTQYYYTTPIGPPWFAPTLIDYDTPNLPEPCALSTYNLDEININLHPNPTHDLLKAEFLDQYNYMSCKIIDMTGKEVWKGKSADLKDGIKVGSYSNGIYNVLFDGKYVGRFVKL